MFIIGEAIVQKPVADSRFSCDLQKCKGACCTLEGGRGAPLLDEEISQIREALTFARGYLDEKHQEHIEKNGFFEGISGDYATTCIDNRACVFVYYQDGIAFCSLERAYNEGKTNWKKPISCHLFPIRVSNGKPAVLRYEQISECDPGVEYGNQTTTSLLHFLEEPLRRRFGDEWYVSLQNQLNGELK